MRNSSWLYILATLCIAPFVFNHVASAQQKRPSPYDRDLRIAVFPVHFQAGVSQSHFGTAAHVEFDLLRGLMFNAEGQLPWWNAAGETSRDFNSGRAGLTWNFVDQIDTERAAGTLVPTDAAGVHGRGMPSDQDLDVSISQRLSGPPMHTGDHGGDREVSLRETHGLRLGYTYFTAVEVQRPQSTELGRTYVWNGGHLGSLGYAWGKQWELAPNDGGDTGWRRIYIDGLFTLRGLLKEERLGGANGPDQRDAERFFGLGVRLGMQGAFDNLIRSARGVGFGYTLELGALPGTSGVEGYLFVGLGMSLDVATGIRR